MIIKIGAKLSRGKKTKLLVIGPKNEAAPPIEGIHVAGEYTGVSSDARNIGVTFDTYMN